MFSFIDRFVLALLVSPLKAHLEVGDVELGLLFGPVFGLFYAVVGLPLARLADRGDRRRLIVAGSLLWAVATTVSGFAETFWLLVALRIGLAIGEAVLTPAAYSMIGDLFPPHRASFAASIYSGVGLLGAYGSYILGSMVIRAVDAGTQSGLLSQFEVWQLTFFAVGIPTIALGVLFALTTREPQRASPAAEAPRLDEVFQYLRRNSRLYIGLLCGAGLLQAVGYGWTALGPEFARREFAWTIQQAGVAFGVAGLLAGPASTVVSPAATSNSPTCGRVKIPHLVAAGRTDDYACCALLARRAADSRSRQLLPSNFSR